jgi:hypothetical protein
MPFDVPSVVDGMAGSFFNMGLIGMNKNRKGSQVIGGLKNENFGMAS